MSSTDGGDLVTDITKLSLNDNFYEWFTTTNLLIDAVNPLNIYDVTPRKGLTEYRAGGNVTIDVNTGKGLKAYPNAAIGALTFDFEALTAKGSVANDDLFVIESPTTGSSNDVYKISASNMLPPTIAGTHEFTGIITAYALNVRDNVLRLQYGDTTTDNSSGLILDTTTSSKVSFLFDTTRSAWFSNRNIGLESGYSFLTNSSTRRSEFRFATNGSSQYDVGLDLLMGLGTTGSDDHSWLIEARHVDKAINFIYKTYANTDVENRIFYATIDSVNPLTSTFRIADKLVIGNVAGSTTNFKSVTDYTASIIPISNASGVLDSKWTNRYVTTSYASGIAVGDLVKVYNDTNNQATVVKCALTTSSTEDEAYSLGIVERVSGGKVWVVMMGEFSGISALSPFALDTGAVYYLTTGSPNYTLTKPTTGIVKPVFVATSATTGVLFPMGAGGSLSFGKFNATASGGTATGSTVSSGSSNDTFTVIAGSGISLATNQGSKSITISAATAGNQPTYSSISTNSGTVSAYRPSETLSLIGSGGIVVSATDVASTNGDQITISGKYFRTISWLGDSTNDIASSKTANVVDDTFQIYAGTGISVQSYSGGLRIDATGTSTPLILANSIPISALFKQNINSILYTPYDASGVSAVTALQSAANTILGSDISTGAISWNSTLNIVKDKLAYKDEASKYRDTDVGVTRYESLHYGLTTSDNTVNSRHFGIIRIPQNNTSLPGIKPIDVAAFMYNTTNSVNGALVGLQEGSGIELTTLNTTSNSISSIPTIKISSKYGAAFNKVRILDTGETVVANAVDTRTVTNLITYSDNLGVTGSFSFPAAPNGGSADYKYAGWGATIPTASNVASITGPLGTSVSAVKYVINVATEDSGHYHIIPNHALGKRYTYSVYAKSETLGTPITFRLGYYNGTSIYSEPFTTSDSWQRFSFSFDVSSAGTLFKPGETTFGGGPPANYRYWTFASSVQVKHRFSSGQSTKAIHMHGAQLEEGQEMTSYISSTGKNYIVTTDASANGATTFNIGNRWEYDFATAQYTMPESHGTLVFSTANSPILLDSDTNSDTIYFGIATNSITNNHLSLMADNTVKVGTGSTNANNTPQDLAIGTNSVLGRVGNGDLKSVSAGELAAIVGGNYFKSIVTDSGTLTAAQSNSIHLRGGSGTVVSVGTNNDIIITGGGSGTGLTLVSDWNGSTGSGVVSPDKLYFNDSDLNYSVTVKSGSEALISSIINWTGITGGASNGGAGLLYGWATANGSPVTQIAQIGNGVASGSQLPFIDAGTGVLSYVKREASQTNTLDRFLGFKTDGTLVATDTIGSSFATVRATDGMYFGKSYSVALMTNTPVSNQANIHLCANESNVQDTSNFNSYNICIGSKVTATTSLSIGDFTISGKGFNSNWNTARSLSIDSNGIFIGAGPSGSTVTTSEGMRVSNDTTANALVFTNYNLSTNASITTRKDRSSRIGLGVLNVDNVVSNAYASMKNTAYITHTYVPSLTTIVDEFTVTDNTKKSYKYLIHCENATGEVFTSELLLLVKMASTVSTTNLVQYGSIGTSAGFSLSFAFVVTGSGPYTGTLTHNGTSGGVAVKLLKYEV